MHKKTGMTSHLVLYAQLTAAVFLVVGTTQAADVGAHFVHYATAENTTLFTSIHHPLTDGRPDAMVHVTQNWNPPGCPGTDNGKVISVYYSGAGRWSIMNQDDSAIPVGAGFNVWIPPADASSFVHTATAGNIDGHWTTIDNPLINSDPDALLRVTHNFNPGGSGGSYNNCVVGVWYNSTTTKWAIFNQGFAAMPVGTSFNVTVLSGDPTASVHRATSGNTSFMWTSIDHPLTNDNPNAIVSVTQNWNPGGVVGAYNDHPIGVYYIGSKWAIFNEDHANMPIGAAFNVSMPSSNRAAFVHAADVGNVVGNFTEIDHPLTNNNPNAIIYATQSWNPGGAGGTFNDHALGVFYNFSRWAVFNQDMAAMPVGASFNVSIPAVDASTFVHAATTENITGNFTTIDHPVTNGDPDAIMHVSQSWNPSGVGGVYNDHAIGVWYNGASWAIFNQDQIAMPEDASFNVLIPEAGDATFVHTATVGNIFGNSTAFHHPLTDGHPHAIVRVTQSWNPGGGTGVYNDHQIGVSYTGAHWSIFNQDGAAMPIGASFNVTVVEILFSDGFESGDVSRWSRVSP